MTFFAKKRVFLSPAVPNKAELTRELRRSGATVPYRFDSDGDFDFIVVANTDDPTYAQATTSKARSIVYPYFITDHLHRDSVKDDPRYYLTPPRTHSRSRSLTSTSTSTSASASLRDHPTTGAFTKSKHATTPKRTTPSHRAAICSTRAALPTGAHTSLASCGMPTTVEGIVDDAIPNAEDYTIYADVLLAYDFMLNHTDIAKNMNRFYIIQVLRSPKGCYATWFRWGRVGLQGQHELKEFLDSESAIAYAERKFREKTGGYYFHDTLHAPWQPVPGKYTYIARVSKPTYDEGTESEMGGDQPYISLEMIAKGGLILEEIRHIVDVLEGRTRSPFENMTLEEIHTRLQVLSSEYYTVVPRSFGMSPPPVINSRGRLAEEVEKLVGLQAATISGVTERAGGV